MSRLFLRRVRADSKGRNGMMDPRRSLDRLRYLRDLMLGRQGKELSDIDRELLRALEEVDRRDGPGAGERLLMELAAPFLNEYLPMEGDTHGG